MHVGGDTRVFYRAPGWKLCLKTGIPNLVYLILLVLDRIPDSWPVQPGSTKFRRRIDSCSIQECGFELNWPHPLEGIQVWTGILKEEEFTDLQFKKSIQVMQSIYLSIYQAFKPETKFSCQHSRFVSTNFFFLWISLQYISMQFNSTSLHTNITLQFNSNSGI